MRFGNLSSRNSLKKVESQSLLFEIPNENSKVSNEENHNESEKNEVAVFNVAFNGELNGGFKPRFGHEGADNAFTPPREVTIDSDY